MVETKMLVSSCVSWNQSKKTKPKKSTQASFQCCPGKLFKRYIRRGKGRKKEKGILDEYHKPNNHILFRDLATNHQQNHYSLTHDLLQKHMSQAVKMDHCFLSQTVGFFGIINQNILERKLKGIVLRACDCAIVTIHNQMAISKQLFRGSEI